ncbi:hypothetical protein MCHUDSM44219_01560 [Mycolicibacterium chubuense]|uniref:Cyclophilin-like domain-containing protein n=1 Tax=Mycolicibacterium chubuense TaxID=1800 RepID=A0A0J6WL25_MYCCU|nr:hypothetical protein MCHUDSM44219_01560 [Mycolicibacterium chubuense]SPY00576.1 Uncharacterized conserved protein [Mycolicibacterium chubuense]
MTLRSLSAVSALCVAVAACSNPDAGPAAPVVDGVDVASQSAPNPPGIQMMVGGRQITAELADNPTARDLATQLPITLDFHDLNGVEKIARLPRALTTDGVPAGADPEVTDIGYYAPSQDLVLYYGDVGYWNGIVRIGRFDRDELPFVQSQPDGFTVTLDRQDTP